MHEINDTDPQLPLLDVTTLPQSHSSHDPPGRSIQARSVKLGTDAAGRLPQRASLCPVGNLPFAHAAPRGDLFRELAEQDQAAATRLDRDCTTLQLDRSRFYADLARRWVFTGRRLPKGPVHCLRKAAGYNRCAEFDSRLQKLPGVKGASLSARYGSLLALIASEMDDIAADFRYTDPMFAEPEHDPLREAREQLSKAHLDVAELQPLFLAMEALYCRLHYKKRYIANPPPPRTPEEAAALYAEIAQRERDARVELSRQVLRDMSVRKKPSGDPIRRAFGWISMEGMLMTFTDDLAGYGRTKPLWVSIPSAEQLSVDYQISRAAAECVLRAYAAPEYRWLTQAPDLDPAGDHPAASAAP